MARTISENSTIGRVSQRQRRIVELQVEIDPYESSQISTDDNETEFVITLNGRVLKRMSSWQFRRIMGIAESK